MMMIMKKTIDVTNKEIKTFSFDLTKVKAEEIDDKVNKFLKTIDGDEMEFNMFPAENTLIISIVYDLD